MISIVLVLLVAYAFCVKVQEKQYFLLNDFDPFGFIFMDQMGYSTGKGTAQFDISYHGTLSNISVQSYLYIGLIPHHRFKQFEEVKNCQDRQSLLLLKQYVPLNISNPSKVKININQSSQTLIDFYLYNCHKEYFQTKQGSHTLYIKVNWDLNCEGSHLNSKEDLLPYYYFITWVLLGGFNFMLLKRYCKLQEKPPIYFWAILIPLTLWIAHTVKLIYLYLHYQTGGYFLLGVGFEIIMSVSQNLLVTLLLVIGFGWTVTYLKDIKDSAGPLGGSIIIANILTIFFSHLLENSTHKNHVFDSIASFIFLIVKVIISIAFVNGILRSYSKSQNVKTQNFLKRFGTYGFLYLISQPLFVIMVHIFASIQLQNQIVTIITDLCHIIGSIIVTQSIVSFSSNYAQLDYNQSKVFRSYDPLKQF